MADSITFSSFELIVDSDRPSADFLNEAFLPGESRKDFGEEVHKIQCDIIDDRFYWLYSNYGKAMPHSDIVLNVKGEEEDNPRTVDQVEPNNQVFVIYDTKYTVLYISNSQKKNFMQKYLSGFTDDEVIIKNVYKDIDDFIDNIKSLETIKFTGRRNLLNKDGDLFRPLGDIFGYGGPEEFSIEATYSVRMASSLRRQILRLSGYKAENQIKSLSVIGKDEKGFESVFNSNNFIKKISLSIGKDNQHLFPCDDVKDKILQKLR